jgi:SMODS and SLOG-associating 2TM effector domain family 4
LEPPSPTNGPIESSKRVLEGQLRECYGRVVYSHKTHEKCADILLGQLSKIKMAQIVLSAVTTGGFISAFLGSGVIGASIGVVVSTVLLVLNAYTKNWDLGELAQKHKQAANDIWLIREKYLSLLTNLAMSDTSLDSVRGERDKLLAELHAVYVGSPSTTYQAYKKAQQSLQRDEDMTFTDKEIDAFLPKELRRIT